MTLSLRHLLVPVVALGLAFSMNGCALIGLTAGLAIKAGMIKLAFRCVPEGTPVDTPGGPVPIENLRAGNRVIGFSGRPVNILQKHEYDEDETSTRFLRLHFDNGAEVRICDMHRVNGTRAMDLRVGDVIEGHAITHVTWFSGVSRSYDLLTEDDGYRIQGIPVNSMIEEMMAAGAAAAQ